ncbi:MAG: hypothetical protein KC731_10440, partial [Myxococcales bacterium]|nr:hypothetical protein [Myxococcales bacterium]
DGHLGSVEVRELRDEASGEPVTSLDDASELRTCVEDAFASSTIPPLSTGRSIAFVGYRVALRDGTQAARSAASERGEVLIGPRTNRCQGLYAYDPPRDVSAVETDLEDSRRETERAGRDRTRLARALQRQYDLTLELAERLAVEGKAEGLSDASRKKYRKELVRARQAAADLGERIGCPAP